ncbi:hypothetical protein D9757_005628 [Collybiopsis confluens]|uniref:Uncharacterized protein n=1 Tax=Collybiopsis confluens TaxID=2823264 RepID=A0A8H5MCD7_9AGAR|nr:hypothetical protein D9757_005628 [Collybiopsis confluens]
MSMSASLLLLVLYPAKIVAKGGGGHGSKGKSSSSGFRGGGGGSSTPVIIHTNSNTCVDQKTNQIVPCPHKLSGGAIAGIVIGSTVGALLLVVLIWYTLSRCYLSTRRRREVQSEEGIPSSRENPYQPLDGHDHPEGVHSAESGPRLDAYAYSTSEEDKETKVYMPEPGGGG